MRYSKSIGNFHAKHLNPKYRSESDLRFSTSVEAEKNHNIYIKPSIFPRIFYDFLLAKSQTEKRGLMMGEKGMKNR